MRQGTREATRQVARDAARLVLVLGKTVVLGLLAVAALVILLAVVRWLYSEWWISQHCTMVFGTRVCR